MILVGGHAGPAEVARSQDRGHRPTRRQSGPQTGRQSADTRGARSWSNSWLRGMQAAHQAKVVHRDLKPANVLLAEASGGRESPVETEQQGAHAPRSPTSSPRSPTSASPSSTSRAKQQPEAHIVGADVAADATSACSGGARDREPRPAFPAWNGRCYTNLEQPERMARCPPPPSIICVKSSAPATR